MRQRRPRRHPGTRRGPFEPAFLSYAEVVEGHARNRPDEIALVTGDRSLSWREFDCAINRVANALLRDGLAPGEPVATLTGNTAWAYVVAFGILKAGGVFTPLSPLLTPRLLARLLADAGATRLFVDQPLLDLAVAAEREGARVAMVVEERAPPTRRSFGVFLGDAPDTPPHLRLDPGDRCNIIYSSGTTGVPKGIVHGHAARVQMGWKLATALRFTPASRALVATPPHSNGTWMMVYPTVLLGGTTILLPKFDPAGLLQNIARHRPTHAFVVPSMWQALLAHPGIEGADFGSFTCLVTAGAPMPDGMKAEVRRRTGDRLFELWGLTESVATVIDPNEMTHRPRSVGRSVIGCDIRIIDGEDRDITGQGVGEIVGRSTSLMEGYLNRPDANAAIRWTDAQGRVFIRTGDIGEIDGAGYLTLRGRAKDMIISGGLNVFPVDIEDVLLEHGGVCAAAVFGVPDARWGESPVAVVVSAPGVSLDPAAVKAWANERLARHQRVKDVVTRGEDLPRNALGKVLKAELREAYLAGSEASGLA